VKVHDRLRDHVHAEDAPRELVVKVVAAKHVLTAKGEKPSCYVKVQIGKKGIKGKTAVHS